MKTQLSRRVYFSCGHRYYNPNFSEEWNQENFGSCYSPHGHGHNYILEAKISGPINKNTGMIINLKDVDQILNEVVHLLDHKHLNFDVAEFKDKVPTTENMALFLFEQIKLKLKEKKEPAALDGLRLYETNDLWVDIQ